MDIQRSLYNQDVLSEIEHMIDDNKIEAKEIYEKANFPVLYHLSKHRQNIIDWYDFKDGSTILHLGAGTGIITQALAKTGNRIIAVDNLEIINVNKRLNKNFSNIIWNIADKEEYLDNCTEQVDYVILDSTLETVESHEVLLKKIYNIVGADGIVIIIGFNKFGLKYFSGNNEFYSQKLFEGIEGFSTFNNAKTFTKNEYIKLLKNNNFRHIDFYYPYPDHLFTEKIFSEQRMPVYGELHNNLRNFDSDKVSLFDESKVYNEIIKSDNFDVFSNSFFIIASKKEVNCPIIYTKFSRERKKEYQISTSIIKKDNTKYVEKRALESDGISHLRNMRDYYVSHNHNKICYCPVAFKDNKLIFEFTTGISLENKLKESVLQKNHDALYKNIEIIMDVINIESTKPFKYTEKFYEVFGNIEGLDGMDAVMNANIDLIPDNIIINDRINIIDYEWLYDFLIPKEYILFRALFHSEAISLMPSEEKYELFEKYGMYEKKRELYFDMEVNFQNYVSDQSNTLSQILRKIDKISQDLKSVAMKKIQEFSILGDGKEIYNFRYINEKEIIKKVYVADCDEIKIIPSISNCILKINNIIGYDGVTEWKIPVLKTNADIIENDNYYFNKKPEIVVNGDGLIWLNVDILIYYVGDKCIPNIINLTKSIEDTNRVLRHNQGKLEIYRNNIFVKILKKVKLLKE